MKAFFVFCFCLASVSLFAQDASIDIGKNMSSANRKPILEALKKKVKPDLKQLPKLVVNNLYVKNGFAFFVGAVKDSTGKDINWSKTIYKEANDEGAFDGEATRALLKKVSGKWKVLAYAIGPTDVAWACWWKEFKAPKEIFDIKEENCDY